MAGDEPKKDVCDDASTSQQQKSISSYDITTLDNLGLLIRSALLTWDPLPEVKDADTTVSREESRRGILESSSVSDSKLNATSFTAKYFNNSRRNFNNNTNNNRGVTSNNNIVRFCKIRSDFGGVTNINRGPNPSLNCKNCGKIGHTIDRCFEIIGFPPGFKRNTNAVKQSFNANTEAKLNNKQSFSSSFSSGFTSKQMQKLLSLINDNSAGSIHANMAGRASFLMEMFGLILILLGIQKVLIINEISMIVP
uniref:CCHC-type domain-containing protein n=1 Tax=Tanacetum cinerariifolium TaxID=118510 RepID=A0A6L2KSJ9_TANCI|nr:hypothetical protein [Tanacetum cinerariifolium]